jgi:prepilin-type processing-associated H-X9-DG protein
VVVSLQDSSKLDAPSTVDLDLVGTPETSGGPTFAAITSRSYHPGGVNALFGDGSVHFIKEGVDPAVWRCLGSVSGGEIIDANRY